MSHDPKTEQSGMLKSRRAMIDEAVYQHLREWSVWQPYLKHRWLVTGPTPTDCKMIRAEFQRLCARLSKEPTQ